MVQRSGRFKTTHTGCYLSAKAYGEVRRFETALYGALLRGQSKKRYLHAQLEISSKELRCYESGGFTKKLCLVIRLPHEIVDVHYTLIKTSYS
jgi:hypothetical protein